MRLDLLRRLLNPAYIPSAKYRFFNDPVIKASVGFGLPVAATGAVVAYNKVFPKERVERYKNLKTKLKSGRDQNNAVNRELLHPNTGEGGPELNQLAMYS